MKSLSIKVTEEIDKKSINKFIKTAINSSDIHIDLNNKNLNYYYVYLSLSKTYEIFVFDYKSGDIIEPFVFCNYFKDIQVDERTVVFVRKDYFVVYLDEKYLLYKEILNSSQEDIELYVNQTYKLNIDNVITVNDDMMNGYKNNYSIEYKKRDAKEFTNINSSISLNSFNLFILYFTFITVISSIFFYTKLNKIPENTKTTKAIYIQDITTKIYNNHQENKPINKMVEFFKYLKINKVNIKNIKYSNDKFNTVISHKNKSKLLEILTMYSKNIQIKNIVYSQKLDIYDMEILIGF